MRRHLFQVLVGAAVLISAATYLAAPASAISGGGCNTVSPGPVGPQSSPWTMRACTNLEFALSGDYLNFTSRIIDIGTDKGAGCYAISIVWENGNRFLTSPHALCTTGQKFNLDYHGQIRVYPRGDAGGYWYVNSPHAFD